jgi:hypothetical protein
VNAIDGRLRNRPTISSFPLPLSINLAEFLSSPSHSRALFLSELPLSFSHSLLAHAIAGVRPRHRSPPRRRASPELRRSSSTRPRSTTTTLVSLTVEHPPRRRPSLRMNKNTRLKTTPKYLFSKSCFEFIVNYCCNIEMMRFGDSCV